jgi:RNA polymerase sigma factor (sigma-70 family)
VADAIDLTVLCRGDKATWDRFVRRYAGLIVSAVRGALRPGAEVEDLVQEVFVRLCKDDYRLLKTYDAARAGLSTWLTIVARSTARDVQCRRQIGVTSIDNVPEMFLAVHDQPREKLQLPMELLSPRQKLILMMLYERDMDVAEIATALRIDPQTVRSTHHKAMLKLRTHFAIDERRAKN